MSLNIVQITDIRPNSSLKPGLAHFVEAGDCTCLSCGLHGHHMGLHGSHKIHHLIPPVAEASRERGKENLESQQLHKP